MFTHDRKETQRGTVTTQSAPSFFPLRSQDAPRIERDIDYVVRSLYMVVPVSSLSSSASSSFSSSPPLLLLLLLLTPPLLPAPPHEQHVLSCYVRVTEGGDYNNSPYAHELIRRLRLRVQQFCLARRSSNACLSDLASTTTSRGEQKLRTSIFFGVVRCGRRRQLRELRRRRQRFYLTATSLSRSVLDDFAVTTPKTAQAPHHGEAELAFI